MIAQHLKSSCDHKQTKASSSCCSGRGWIETTGIKPAEKLGDTPPNCGIQPSAVVAGFGQTKTVQIL
ncbi:MAG TPA: hypothetical protein VH878_06665 [Thermodesulfobacteriota bacterium]